MIRRKLFKHLFEYTHVQAFVMSSAFSILLYLLTSWGQLDKIVAASFSTFAGLMSFLIFERQFISDKFQVLEKNLLSNLLNRVYARKFDDVTESVNYIAQNAHSCKRIINTRFLSRSNIPIEQYIRIMADHDDAISDAVKNGCNYEMVIDIQGSRYIEGLHSLPPIAQRTDVKGLVTLHWLDPVKTPILQITILVFKDGRKECLIGWDNGVHLSADLHFRDSEDPKVTQFFESLFEQYQRSGTPITSKLAFDALVNRAEAMGNGETH